MSVWLTLLFALPAEPSAVLVDPASLVRVVPLNAAAASRWIVTLALLAVLMDVALALIRGRRTS